MSEQEADQPQLPLVGVGPRLKAAREAMGISRPAMAQRTRIAERLIAEMEAGNWAALPSRTYATGFTRSYARSVGLNEAEMVLDVRREMGIADPVSQRPTTAALEPGDPARVPSSKFAWWLAALALAVAVGGYFAWRTLYSPALVLPLPEETASAEAVVTTEATAAMIGPTFPADATFAPTESAEQSYAPTAQRRPAPRETRRPDEPATPSPQPIQAPIQAVPQQAAPATPSTVSN
jgi:cytoskeletal protein RodZ